MFAFDFDLVRTLPTVSAYADEHGYPSVEEELADAICLGDSWGGVLIVLAPAAWNVLTIDLTDKHEDMLVNSNVESLGASLAAYASLGPLRGKVEPAQLSSELERMLRSIDPPCVQAWWSTVIQEVAFGLA